MKEPNVGDYNEPGFIEALQKRIEKFENQMLEFAVPLEDKQKNLEQRIDEVKKLEEASDPKVEELRKVVIDLYKQIENLWKTEITTSDNLTDLLKKVLEHTKFSFYVGMVGYVKGNKCYL